MRRSGVTLDFMASGGGSPASSPPPDHWLLLASSASGTDQRPPPVRVHIEQGALPITAIFQEKLGIDTVMFRLATADEDLHSPNEFFRLSSLKEGLRAWPMLLSEVNVGRLGSSGA